MRIIIKKYEKLLMIAGVTLAAFFFSEIALAASSSGLSGPSLGGIAKNITGSFQNLAKLITAGSYIAGFGFSLGAILKFKQHKDNPQQIPIGTPIAMLFVAAALIFLPTIFGTANQTIFGGSGVIGGVSGVAT
jgi:intracellular multiplication protein IcmD